MKTFYSNGIELKIILVNKVFHGFDNQATKNLSHLLAKFQSVDFAVCQVEIEKEKEHFFVSRLKEDKHFSIVATMLVKKK